jgi:hypothetical protein
MGKVGVCNGYTFTKATGTVWMGMVVSFILLIFS